MSPIEPIVVKGNTSEIEPQVEGLSPVIFFTNRDVLTTFDPSPEPEVTVLSAKHGGIGSNFSLVFEAKPPMPQGRHSTPGH